jgi:hypothetical protein
LSVKEMVRVEVTVISTIAKRAQGHPAARARSPD